MGQAPSLKGDGRPFTGPSGQTLSELIGMPVRSVFDCRNLSDYWRSDAKPEWHPKEAEWAAARVPEVLDINQRFILVGRKVAQAFRLGDKNPYLDWIGDYKLSYQLPYGPVAIFPHPSGLNRWWNSSENREQAKWFLLDELKLTGFIT